MKIKKVNIQKEKSIKKIIYERLLCNKEYHNSYNLKKHKVKVYSLHGGNKLKYCEHYSKDLNYNTWMRHKREI